MEPFMYCALLALALTDSLPTPAYSVDGPEIAYTVEAYMDTNVVAWATYGLGPVDETPEDGQVLVLLWLPGQDTGVETTPMEPEQQPDLPGTGCGRIFSWRK